MKKNKLKLMDKPLLIMIVLYSIIGVFAILSASSVTAVITYNVNPYYFFIKQILIVIGSFIAGFLVILKVPTKKYRKLLPWILGAVLFLLVYVLLRGKIVNSAKSWINLGFIKFQPSELAKISVILLFGVFYGEIDKMLDIKYSFLIPVIYSVIVFALIFLQPDLGTGLIVAFIAMLVFFAVPFQNNKMIKYLKVLAGAGLVSAIVFVSSGVGGKLLNEMQSSRLTFKAPCTRYLEETGYQVCNGFIAIHNGGLFGKGIGKSTQKYLYLPESHTDFIFPIIVEETGLIGGLVIIAGFVFILYRILLIAKNASNLRNSIIAYGCGIYLLVHLLINFCGILALIPMTGTPVPFLSYGGTFTLTLISVMMVVLRISIENKLDNDKRELKSI